MPRPNPKLTWCVVRIGEDMNWWVEEISDEIHWDVDSLGIIDPRQWNHIMDLCDSLREYGFDPDILHDAFFALKIEKELKKGQVRLVRTNESLIEDGEEQALFALPDVMDEEKGPYADFLDTISRLRVKMLNDVIDFEQKLTIDELEEEIRERQNNDYFESRAVHFFNEITSILEYVPEGYEADDDDPDGSDKEDLDDIPDFDEPEEKIEEDETMRWDEEEEPEAEEEPEQSSPPE